MLGRDVFGGAPLRNGQCRFERGKATDLFFVRDFEAVHAATVACLEGEEVLFALHGHSVDDDPPAGFQPEPGLFEACFEAAADEDDVGVGGVAEAVRGGA